MDHDVGPDLDVPAARIQKYKKTYIQIWVVLFVFSSGDDSARHRGGWPHCALEYFPILRRRRFERMLSRSRFPALGSVDTETALSPSSTDSEHGSLPISSPRCHDWCAFWRLAGRRGFPRVELHGLDRHRGTNKYTLSGYFSIQSGKDNDWFPVVDSRLRSVDGHAREVSRRTRSGPCSSVIRSRVSNRRAQIVTELCAFHDRSGSRPPWVSPCLSSNTRTDAVRRPGRRERSERRFRSNTVGPSPRYR